MPRIQLTPQRRDHEGERITQEVIDLLNRTFVPPRSTETTWSGWHRGFAAQTTAGLTIYLATKYGNIVIAWLLTLPMAAFATGACFYPVEWLF
jgi:hypothetical protein